MDIDSYYSSSSEETVQRGGEFSHGLHAGDTVAFYGDLGAGKTEFINGICEAMSVEQIVSSPTYTIVNQYVGWDNGGHEVTIYHIDLYRLASRKELDETGVPELLDDPTAIKLIEWSEHAASLLPPDRYEVHIDYDEERGDMRRIEIIDRHGAAYAAALNGGAVTLLR